MAREMALAGVDRSELTPPPPPEQPKTAKGKWDNFWYHYKPLVLIVTVLAVIVLVLGVQTVTKDPADYTVVAVTDMALYPPEIEALESYLASVGTDADGDGKVEVTLENLVPTYSADGTTAIGLADQQKLINYIASGENMLFVFDEVSYDGFCESIREVTSDDYAFFASLDIAKDGYDAEGRFWHMSADARCDERGITELVKTLIIGVRSPEVTASGRKAALCYEQGVALIQALAE